MLTFAQFFRNAVNWALTSRRVVVRFVNSYVAGNRKPSKRGGCQGQVANGRERRPEAALALRRGGVRGDLLRYLVSRKAFRESDVAGLGRRRRRRGRGLLLAA